MVLVLVLVLKDSLRTYLKSLSMSWSLGGQVQEVLVPVLILGGQVLVLVLVLGVMSLSLSWSLGSGPCPYPCPWGVRPRRSLSLGVRSLLTSLLLNSKAHQAAASIWFGIWGVVDPDQ